MRTDNIDVLNIILEPVFTQKNAKEWVDILENAKVPCSPINNIEDVMKQKQILARNMLIDVDDKQAGKIKIAGNPLKMCSVPEEKERNPAPDLGEHNTEIFKTLLGYDDAKIDKLKQDKII